MDLFFSKILVWFEYAELHGAVHFFCFILQTLYLVNEVKQRAIIVSTTLRE